MSTSTAPVLPAAKSTIRWRWLAACIGLAAVAFLQDPGRIAADTKLDLTADPGGLLSRALNLWEPLGFFGQLTNQGYGYFVPMGPFFWAGESVGIPDWVVQRLWWSALLVVAFLGVVRLTRLLGLTGFAPRLAAGLAFALGPRMVTELGVLSVEVLPYAVAPWVLIPLVAVSRGGSYRRAAGLSGLAVFAAGGVNAVASAAVLPLAAWWILTRFTGRARWVLGGWWALAVAAATLWWAIPLVLLGRYSPPFLDWIESAAITTSITAPDTVLRGTSQWVAYIADTGGPVWPSGWSLVTQPAFIAATGVLAAIGVGGLALSGAKAPRWRTFLLGGLLIGWLFVGIGHVGALSGLGSDVVRSLLDGALAPLRNTHKFEVLVRLPIAIGVGYAVSWLLARRFRAASVSKGAANVGLGLLVLALALSATPALTGEMTRDRSFASIPGYWEQASTWLAQQESSGRALVVPGASFGVYSWGRTNDEPLQALGEASWVVRDAVPLASAGAIRWLDAIAERLSTGRGSPGLSAALARAGIEWIVIRNDLDRRRAGSARPEAIRQALVRSTGFTPVTGFGPVIPPFRTSSTVVDNGLIDVNTAIEVWRVDSQAGGSDPRVAVRPLTDVLVTSGASEAVVDLVDAGMVDSGTVMVLSGDERPLMDAIGDGSRVRTGITDTFQRSEVIFGRSWNNRTQVLGEFDSYSADRAVHDYVPDERDPASAQTVAIFEGGSVTASSSGADVDAVQSLGAQSAAYSAIDGDLQTAWRSGELLKGVGQWWQVTWPQPVDITDNNLSVRFASSISADPDDAPRRVTVTTDQGAVTSNLDGTDSWARLSIARGATRSLRITLVETAGATRGADFAIAEVALPRAVQRFLAVPGSMDGGPAAFTAQRGETGGCLSVGGIIQCSRVLSVAGSERAGIARVFSTDREQQARIAVRVRPRPGSDLDSLLIPLGADSLRARASSQLVPDPAARAQAAVDGSLETAWVADPDDQQPTLRLSWQKPRTVQGVRLSVDSRLAASLPLTVTVTVNGAQTTAVVDSSGRVRVPTQEATGMTVRFDNTVALRSLDPLTGGFEPVPIAISEITVLGATDLIKGPLPGQFVAAPCGFGPDVIIDGRVVTQTSVTMTVGEALTDAVVSATPCDARSVLLAPGDHRLQVPASSAFLVESVVLDPRGSASPVSTTEAVDVVSWEPAHRTVMLGPSDSARLVETTENFNPGWIANMGMINLTPIRVDGWRQAFIVPAGAQGVVTMEFAPNSTYRAGLLVGALAIIGLIVLAAFPVRKRHDTASSPSAVTGRVVLVGLAVCASLALTGVVGLGVAVLGTGATWWAMRKWGTRVQQLRSAIAVTSLIAASGIAATMPWPDRLSAPTWWSALVTGFTVLGLAAAVAPRRFDFPSDDASIVESDAR